ncbi:hypothetical protein BOTBODRAFT_186936 [Botryobasidium botryosum FD-172 SS1]|uniref:Uncharacterized protein n=1 Tax=Botryobasidium botryosum (strain FD-172 SS1) TaxID=930990 RepID=A0A067MMG1_BOTB1|nr:hypothetical protein BOTBODRAFT_186936 [Botryobasidium botryosum FD-172 SS1]
MSGLPNIPRDKRIHLAASRRVEAHLLKLISPGLEEMWRKALPAKQCPRVQANHWSVQYTTLPMFAFLASTLLLAASAVAQLTITQPSSALWWVNGEQDTMAWSCTTNTQWPSFTVLVQNPTLQAIPLAIIAIQNNFDCSHLLTPQVTPGTGWVLQFANPINNTEVYATSQPFEVKAAGSAYPTNVTTNAPAAATGTSSGAHPSGTSGSSGSGSGSGSHSNGASSGAAISWMAAAGLVLGATAFAV